MDIFGFERLPDFGGRHLPAGCVADFLDGPAEVDLQHPRQLEPIVALQEEGYASLPGLAVHANDRLICAADIFRIDWQVRNIPRSVLPRCREPLLDGVLVRAGKRSKDQLSCIGVSWMDRQTVAGLGALDHFVDVVETQPRIHALRVHVEREGDDIDVSGALTIAEQRAFNAIGTRHQSKLGSCHRRSTIVVRMYAQNNGITSRDVAAYPLDLVGVDVGGAHLYRGGQIDDRRSSGSGLPNVEHGFANLDRIVHLRSREALRGILKDPLRFRILPGVGLQQAGAVHSDVLDAALIQAKDHPALDNRRRVVNVNDRSMHTPQGIEGASHQFFACLHQYLYGYVFRHSLLLN